MTNQVAEKSKLLAPGNSNIALPFVSRLDF
jgi:hypothetical protein